MADYIRRGARTKSAAARITFPAEARPDPNPIATNFVPSSVKLSAEDFEQFDYNAGFPGCAYAGGRRVDSANCRRRMEEHIAQDEDGKRRLE